MDGADHLFHRPLAVRALTREEVARGALMGAETKFGGIKLRVLPAMPLDAPDTDFWYCAGCLGDDQTSPCTALIPASLIVTLLEAEGITDEPARLAADLRPLLLDAALAAQGGPFLPVLSLDRLDPATGPPTAPMLALEVTVGGQIHHAAIDLDIASLERLAQSAALSRSRVPIPALRVPVALECAAVRLPLASLRAARAGDVIVVPGLTLSQRSLELVLGNARRWRLRLDTASGHWEVLELMQPSPQPPEQDAPSLDAITIELTFEVTRVTREVAEIESWRPGQVVRLPELDAARATTVSIVAAGRVIGIGEIVAIGDEAGIQLRWIGTHDSRHP
jgi:type III secretion system YscQ/HrcQ family protein